jgi:regulatory protein
MDEPPSADVTIVEVIGGKRRMQLLRLSDGRDFIFSREACDRHGIRPGVRISEETLAELDAAEQRLQAHEAALRLLSQRSRAEHEMRQRLRMRGFAPEVVDEEIVRLRAAGLVDDERFAESWVADRQRLSPRGRRMLRYELLGRGIAPEAVDRATSGIDDLDVAIAAARARTRKIRDADYEAFATRVGAYLQRRGFGYDVVTQALRKVWAEVAATAEGGIEVGEATS